MRWSDLPLNPTEKILRQFSVCWLVVIGAFAVHSYWVRGNQVLGIGLGIGALVGGGAGLVWPKSIRWLFIAATVAAFPIGWVVSQAVLAVMFYGILTPIALLLRLRGRDLLARNPKPEQKSWWIAKPAPTNLTSYFRQY